MRINIRNNTQNYLMTNTENEKTNTVVKGKEGAHCLDQQTDKTCRTVWW